MAASKVVNHVKISVVKSADGQYPLPPVSLETFVLRSEVLRLYRDMLRVVKRIPSVEQQAELRQWIRTDFDNNKHHTDEAVIRMMITKGRMSLRELEQSLQLVS